jgi:arylsulfatase A-like enzyme
MYKVFWFSIGVVLLFLGCSSEEPMPELTVSQVSSESAFEASRPNFLIITTDDMGYTDLGAFGGHDIPTPNLDGLAMQGVRLANFHVSASCAPTRTMLMSGTGNHEGGMGTQRANEFGGYPGYERHIADRVLTMPERMSAAGYHTYMAGKWHLGTEAGVNLPNDRGYERSFALLPGGFDHFKLPIGQEPPQTGSSLPVPYTEDGVILDDIPEDFYSTNAYVDKMLVYLQSNEGDGQPFFAWFAPTAPHWPLQVLPDWKDRFVGNYDAGYDALCVERQRNALEAGVLPGGADFSMCPEIADSWDELSEDDQALHRRTMELYAAMTAHMDSEFGRILDYLEESGQLDNTYIIYSNDNGPQGGVPFTARSRMDRLNNELENLGNRDSWVSIGQGWTDAQSAPFRGNKGSQFEGGIRVPAFIKAPNSAGAGQVSQSLLTIMDVLPTVMDIAGIEEVSVSAEGSAVLPIRGKSFAGLLTDSTQAIHGADEYIALDLGGVSVLMQGSWKIVRPARSNDWLLFDTSVDPSETKDLSSENPNLLAELAAKYEDHATATGIMRTPFIEVGRVDPGGG